MSAQYGKLVSLILLENFGEVVQKVGTYLFKYGHSALVAIIKGTELPISKVKFSLCVLIKYGLVTFKPGLAEGYALYQLLPDKVLLLLRYPRYITLIKKKFGDIAEVIIEEVLRYGNATASDIIVNVLARSKEKEQRPSLAEIRDKFASLVSDQYLMRYPSAVEEKPVPDLKIPEKELYLFPNLNMSLLTKMVEGESVDPGDANVYWRPNFDRFNQDIRDRILVDAITRTIDENAGELMRLLLQQMYIRTEPWAETSNPVPFVELRDVIRKLNTHPRLVTFLDQYLNVIENDSCSFIRKVGDASGGQYSITMKAAIIQLTWTTLEKIVLEKFDTKAARIFRLVRAKKFIEPDHIQQLAMIPAKEAKRLTYQLLEENFLQLQELRKAPSNVGPNKSFTLFHVDQDKIVRMVLELCYKAIYNAMTRKHHDKVVHKRIIDKKHKVDSIAMSLKAQGIEDEQLTDIEGMVTPPERLILEKIGKTMKKLNIVEMEIDETVFLLHLYLYYT